jgi:hypothetical protein
MNERLDHNLEEGNYYYFKALSPYSAERMEKPQKICIRVVSNLAEFEPETSQIQAWSVTATTDPWEVGTGHGPDQGIVSTLFLIIFYLTMHLNCRTQ